MNGKAMQAGALEETYFQTRFPAMALALALTLDPEAAYKASAKAHIRFGAGKRRSKDTVSLLRGLLGKAPLAKVPAAPAGERAYLKLAEYGRAQRGVWALKEVCGFAPKEIQAVTGVPEGKQAEILSGMSAKLGPRDAGEFKALTEGLLARKELWADIQFGIGKRRSAGAALLRVLAAALAALALFFIVREARVYFSIMRKAPEPDAKIASARYADDDFYKRYPEEPSPENPRVSRPLMEELKQFDDSQTLRVAFRFYDREAMLSATENGKNLEDWYGELYAASLDAGKVNILAANAVTLYYSNYVRPFRTQERAQDFKSDYPGILEAALSLTKEGAFAQTVSNHPEIFGDEEGFLRYLLSQAFLSEAPYLHRLLTLEAEIRNSAKETRQMRQDYEDAVFAFTNPSGLAGVATAQGFHFDSGSLKGFYPVRERLGQRLYEDNLARCQALFPEQAQLASDVLEGGESSLFSATISRGKVLELSRDERFFFLGLAPQTTANPAGRIEAELALKAYGGLWQRHDIYLIDEDYLLYSINFAAPLNLPRRFISDLRDLLDCENTLFEKELQYHYKMRFAHPQTRYGYGILRLMDKRPGLGFTSRQFKYFSRMSND